MCNSYVSTVTITGPLFSLGVMSGSSASSSSCTVTYVDGSASVSCVDSTSSGYQVILLQDNDPYNLTVINVGPGEKQTVPVVPKGRYCIMEIVQDGEDKKVRSLREFTAAAESVRSSTTATCELVLLVYNIHVIILPLYI